MSEPLAQALRISGASLIMLTSIETRTVVWSAGRARVGADVAALGAAITEAAAEMVRLSSAAPIDDGTMDDLLVTGPAHFHVLRVADGQVAHLVLDRGVANLAMARREFRQILAGRSPALPAAGPVVAEPVVAEPVFAEPVSDVAVESVVEATEVVESPEAADIVEAAEDVEGAEVVDEAEVVEEVAGAVAVRATAQVHAGPIQIDFGPPEALLPRQRNGERYPVGEALEGEVLPASTIDPVPTDSDLPRLPQRRADAAWQDDPTAYQATVPALPGWLRAAAEGPFVNDLQTLDRVVGGLRRLP
jgi:hypothetical protein